MNVNAETPRSARTIGGKPEGGTEVSFKVQVPQPYVAGSHTLTDGEASALNQIIAENLSNNLRKRLIEGKPAVEANAETGVKAESARPWTAEEAQKIVDAYLVEYEIGVRRAASGERQVTDPVEREARKIARQKAVAMIKEQGGKPGDYDLGPIVDAIFDANKDLLMKEGKKVVEAARKAQENSSISLEGINLTPKAPKATGEAAGETANEDEEASETAEAAA